MKILKFKLISNGRDGITVDATETINTGKWKVSDHVQRTRKMPISDELTDLIQRLKYYYLNLTGHWISPYSNFYDDVNKKLLPVPSESPKPAHMTVKDIWSKTLVTGARIEKDGFLITGTVESVEGKKVGITTATITESDDIGFYADCLAVLHDIAEGISEYFSSHEISIDQAKRLLPEEAKTMTADELIEEAMKRFIDDDYFVMKGIKQDEKAELNTGTGSIDSKDKPEAETVKEEKTVTQDQKNKDIKAHVEGNKGEQEGSFVGSAEGTPIDPTKQTAKAKEPFGKPAANIPADVSGNVATKAEEGAANESQGDMSGLEHSENMGIVEDENQNNTQKEDDW